MSQLYSSNFSFKIDPHIHTAEVSLCGHLSAVDIVQRYYNLGYNGIVITDHLHHDYISSLECKDDWTSCVGHFISGYELAKKEGDRLGLKVILGAEIRFLVNDSDYLLYGIDKDFLLRVPYLYEMDHREFFTRYEKEILLIQAHPFRNKNEILVDYIHGVEVYNANKRHNNYNEKAVELCKENKGLHRMQGSDTHQNGDEGRAFMMLDRVVDSSVGFRDCVKENGYM